MSSRIAIFAALILFIKLSYHIIVLWNEIADPKEMMGLEDCRDSFDDEPGPECWTRVRMGETWLN